MLWIAASKKDAANREVRCLWRKVLQVRQSRRLCRVAAAHKDFVTRQTHCFRRTHDLLRPRLLSGDCTLKL